VAVERRWAAPLFYLALYSLGSELFRRLQAKANRPRVRDNRNVLSFSLDLRLADLDQEVLRHRLVADGKSLAVHQLVLEDYDCERRRRTGSRSGQR